MPDTSLICRDCGETFLFTEGEQEFFRAQGFASAPRRCRACRAKQRQKRPRSRHDGAGSGHGSPAAAALSVGDGSGGALHAAVAAPPPRAPRPREGPMHPTTCSRCGAATEVPFVPDGVRPVYCLPCLKQQTR